MKKPIYKATGRVVKGKMRGKGLGFPTANLATTYGTEEGIYVSQTIVDNQVFPSVTFIGKAKTFDENEVRVETHILDFDQDIYDKEITVELLSFIRPNKKFATVEDLILAMEGDKEKALAYFRSK